MELRDMPSVYLLEILLKVKYIYLKKNIFISQLNEEYLRNKNKGKHRHKNITSWVKVQNFPKS